MNNEFTGSIPKGIGNLVELQRLSFRNNSLIGTLFLSFLFFLFILSLSTLSLGVGLKYETYMDHILIFGPNWAQNTIFPFFLSLIYFYFYFILFCFPKTHQPSLVTNRITTSRRQRAIAGGSFLSFSLILSLSHHTHFLLFLLFFLYFS